MAIRAPDGANKNVELVTAKNELIQVYHYPKMPDINDFFYGKTSLIHSLQYSPEVMKLL